MVFHRRPLHQSVPHLHTMITEAVTFSRRPGGSVFQLSLDIPDLFRRTAVGPLSASYRRIFPASHRPTEFQMRTVAEVAESVADAMILTPLFPAQSSIH